MKAKKLLLIYSIFVSTKLIAQISVGGNITTGGGSGSNGELSISTASGSITGIPIGETKFSDFIVKLKSLNVGVDTPDIISDKIGKALHITKQGGGSVWKYNYIVSDDKTVEENEKCNHALELLEKSDMYWTKKLEKKENIFTILDKLRDKFKTQADCQIVIGNDGKLTSIKVQKISGGNNEVLYVKGDIETSSESSSSGYGVLPAKDSAPPSPMRGQTYFNNSDFHFYGWNGKEWKQLDN